MVRNIQSMRIPIEVFSDSEDAMADSSLPQAFVIIVI